MFDKTNFAYFPLGLYKLSAQTIEDSKMPKTKTIHKQTKNANVKQVKRITKAFKGLSSAEIRLFYTLQQFMASSRTFFRIYKTHFCSHSLTLKMLLTQECQIP